MTKPTEEEIKAAAAWLVGDDTAYREEPQYADRAARAMLEAAYGARVAVECMDAMKREARSTKDTEWWLYEYQKAMTNVRYLLMNGQSERATALIDETAARWASAVDQTPKRAVGY